MRANNIAPSKSYISKIRLQSSDHLLQRLSILSKSCFVDKPTYSTLSNLRLRDYLSKYSSLNLTYPEETYLSTDRLVLWRMTLHSSSSVAQQLRVPTLKGPDNYLSWKKGMQFLLECQGLWPFVNGEELPPLKHIKAEDGSEVRNPDYAEWKAREGVAQSRIGLNVSPKIQIFLQNCETAKEMWDRLENRFQGSKFTRVYQANQKLRNMRLTDYKNAEKYCASYRAILSDLEMVGFVFDPHLLIADFLMSLGPAYEFWVSLKRSQAGKTLPSLDELMEELRDEERLHTYRR